VSGSTDGVPAVVVDNVSKTFTLPKEQVHTLKERALHPFRRPGANRFEALNDVSFAVPRGEFFGIVGRNGSGKSTLLKCMAGIYGVDSGSIYLNGRVSTFIELGVGFNPDLAARDNIALNAIMLGLSPRDARERFDRVIQFAELEEFVDLKLKNYSSGMNVRLAFSVMIQADADVLLVDEVLAVGDANFQQKCFDQFTRLKADGRTIVFVTHDMGSVERYCDRAVVVERGSIVGAGDPHEMTRKYNELNFGRQLAQPETGEEERYGDHRVAEIRAAWFEDATGETITAIPQDEPCTFCFEAAFHTEIVDPVFGLNLRNEVGIAVFATSTYWKGGATGRFDAGDAVVIRIPFDNRLAPSHYRATPSIAREGLGADALDVREDLAMLLVHGPRHTGGSTDLEHDIELRRE
jgi:ABC-type polysaccharide/polyol phosphate transport system ATPase subunit